MEVSGGGGGRKRGRPKGWVEAVRGYTREVEVEDDGAGNRKSGQLERAVAK